MFSFKKTIMFPITLSLLFSGYSFAQKTILLKDSLIWEIIAEVSGELQVNNIMQMAPNEMDSGLPESHDVHKHSHAAWELANFIDGKRTMLEIAHAVIAECGGPMPEKSAEFFYGLERNGVIELINRTPH
jgi:hypothetical protein